MRDKLLTGLYIFLVFILLLTFSIGLPIYFRPFYYMQIEPLEIPRYTGRTVEQIKEAYDQVLDYLTIPGREFGTGVFLYSEEGASHFADCKKLFDLNAVAFLLSLFGVSLLTLLNRSSKVRLLSFRGFTPGFFAGTGALSIFAVLGILVSLDFNTAFVIFHSIFFPGKDNWLFNPRTDQIIGAMPEEFFMNCAILIASSIILISLALIIRGIAVKIKSEGR